MSHDASLVKEAWHRPAQRGALVLAVWGLGLLVQDLWLVLDAPRLGGWGTWGLQHGLWFATLFVAYFPLFMRDKSIKLSKKTLLKTHAEGLSERGVRTHTSEAAGAAQSAVAQEADVNAADDADQDSPVDASVSDTRMRADEALSQVEFNANAPSVVQDISRLGLNDDQQAHLTLERQRIAQDLHDGIGSQLASLIAGLDQSIPEKRKLALNLESCLAGLKTSVDRIDDESDTNIFDELGRLRYRFQPAFQRAGIRLHWRVEPHGPLMRLSAQQRHQIQLIAQEAMTNVLVHSDASDARLVCEFEESPRPQVMLEIMDNGVGIARSSASTRQGRGLSGFKKRALELGGQLKIRSREGVGTRITLHIPLALD